MAIEDVTEKVNAGGQAGHAVGGRGRRPPQGHGRDRKGLAREDRACAATSSRSTRAASITCTGSRNTPTCGSSSRRSSRSPFSAATRTISSIPRYDLDICFFRVYENGKPAKIEHYLKWSKAGAGQRTDLRLRPPRQDEPAQHRRRPRIPARSSVSAAAAAPEPAGSAAHGLQRPQRRERPPSAGHPVQRPEQPQGTPGGLAGLLDPAIMGKKKGQRRTLAGRGCQGPQAQGTGRRLGKVAKAVARQKEVAVEVNMLEGGSRLQQSTCSPSPARWSAPPTSGPSRTGTAAASSASRTWNRCSCNCSPRSRSTTTSRQLKLADSLAYLAEHSATTTRDQDRWPASRRPTAPPSSSRAPRSRTSTSQEALRGRQARPWPAANDPMIALAKADRRRIPPAAQDHRERSRRGEAAGLRQDRQGQVRRSKATSTYPDATFTLRLSFGTVKGYDEDGKQVPSDDHISPAFTSARKSTTTSRRSTCRQRWHRTQEPARPEDAVQLRLHGRHHRRQLRQPGHQQGRRSRRHRSSTATSSRWCWISSTPMKSPGRCRCTRGHHRSVAQGVRRRQAGR